MSAQRQAWQAAERAHKLELRRHPPPDLPPQDCCPQHPTLELTFTTEDGVAYQCCASCGASRIPRRAPS